jgi:hypothetical protein
MAAILVVSPLGSTWTSSPGGAEVPVGDVDRDALLALGAQPVGEQREVDVVALAGPLDRRVLVLEDRLAVVEQPADERALAVVDRAGGGDPQDVLAGDGDVVGLLGRRGVEVYRGTHQK